MRRRRKVLADKHECGGLIVHWDENGLFQAPAQLGVSLGGEGGRVGDEQYNRLDQFLSCFVFEADLRHDFKELIEQPLAEIDDRRAPVIARMRSNSAI